MASGPTENLAEAALKGFVIKDTSFGPTTDFKVHLVTSAVVPDWDTDTLIELTEIATGGGYDGTGITVEDTATGFPTIDESAADDDWRAKIKDLTLNASGSAIPPSGAGASYAVLCDDNVTVGSRKVYAFYDLGGAQTIGDGNSLTIKQTTRGQWDVGIARV